MEDTNRQRWGRRIEFYMSFVGYAFGGDMLRFPYLVMKNGGGTFLIPFAIFHVFGAIPVVYMESLMGQYSQSGVVPAWNVCPLLKGVGYGTTVVTFLYAIYYGVIICWMLLYLIYSFWPTLPWSTCDNDWNVVATCTITKYAKQTADVIAANTTDALTLLTTAVIQNTTQPNTAVVANLTSSEQFWRYKVLDISSGLEELGSIQWSLFGCLAAIQVACFICLFKGVHVSGKVVYITVLGPFLLLIVFLVRGAILPGAEIGIKYYLTPDINKLRDVRIWAEACMQVFYSVAAGMGGMITFSSFNTFNNNCLRDAVTVCLLDTLAVFVGGFVVFAIMGHVTYRNGIPIDEFSRSGLGLGFIAYPEAANYLPPPQLWCALFFFMYGFLGFNAQFPSYGITVTALTDEFPNQLRDRKTALTVLVIGVSFLLAIPHVTQGGFYLLTLMDWYTATFSISIIALFEVITMTYIYGINRLNKNVIEMTGKGVPVFFRICWLFVTPLLLGVTLICACITYVPPTVGGYKYPTWAIGLGWMITACPLVPIPLYAMYKLYITPGTFSERIHKNLQPADNWGPQSSVSKPDITIERQHGAKLSPTNGNASYDNQAFH